MSDKFVRYGDRTMALDDGMTLDQAKELMARHFPELADPKIETVKKDDKTTYVFSKKAGHKGNGQMNALIAEINQHCIATPIVAPAVLRMIESGQAENVYEMRALAANLRDDANAVRAAANALLDLPSAITPTGSVL